MREPTVAEWRVEPRGDGRWWLMSGTNTLGVIRSERTAKSIVRDHNDMEAATSAYRTEHAAVASTDTEEERA